MNPWHARHSGHASRARGRYYKVGAFTLSHLLHSEEKAIIQKTGEAGVAEECRTVAYQRGGYFYRSRREGGHVVTEYLGCGDIGRTIANLDALDQARRQAERRMLQQQEAVQNRLDDCIDNAGDLVRVITNAALLSNGYHLHKGQWRKVRAQRNQ